jgi:hypothetical protein
VDAGATSPWRDYVVGGCEHLNDDVELGPVTAAADPSGLGGDAGAGAVLPVEHGHTTINLVDFEGAKGGWLEVHWAPAHADSNLWMVMEQEGVEVALHVGGTALAPVASLDRESLPANCGSEPHHAGHLWVFHPAAGTHRVKLTAPADTTVLRVVTVDSGDAHHHGD